MYIDSHCHLTFPDLQQDLPTIFQDMAREKVEGAVCVCTELEEFSRIHQLVQARQNLWCTVGVHPDYEESTEPSIDELVRLGSLPKVIGIGETGLDYYRLNGRSLAEMEWQRERFRVHIRAARQLNKPLIIHTRSAADETIRLLKEEGEFGGSDAAGGVFHCFTETWEIAKAALELGFYISFSGIVTFKNAHVIHQVAQQVPLNRLLIETDSPYLAPVPYRGKTNNPSYVPLVAKYIADLRGESLSVVAKASTQNFFNLFRVDEEIVRSTSSDL